MAPDVLASAARLSPSLDASVAAVPEGKRGRLDLTAARSGLAASVGWKARPWLDVSAVAAKPWRGPVEAAARVRVMW